MQPWSFHGWWFCAARDVCQLRQLSRNWNKHVNFCPLHTMDVLRMEMQLHKRICRLKFLVQATTNLCGVFWVSVSGRAHPLIFDPIQKASVLCARVDGSWIPLIGRRTASRLNRTPDLCRMNVMPTSSLAKLWIAHQRKSVVFRGILTPKTKARTFAVTHV
jgi:hypothetical protein